MSILGCSPAVVVLLQFLLSVGLPELFILFADPNFPLLQVGVDLSG